MSIYTHKAFWVATTERAVKTFAQSAGALLAGDGLGVVDVDWGQVGNIAGLAAILSVLFSVGSAQVGEPGPSLASEAITPPAVVPPGAERAL